MKALAAHFTRFQCCYIIFIIVFQEIYYCFSTILLIFPLFVCNDNACSLTSYPKCYNSLRVRYQLSSNRLITNSNYCCFERFSLIIIIVFFFSLPCAYKILHTLIIIVTQFLVICFARLCAFHNVHMHTRLKFVGC